MKLIINLIQRVYRRVFHGGKPSPKVTPEKIHGKQKDTQVSAKEPEVTPPKQDRSSYWRDRLDAETTDDIRNFRKKYRSRLDNQDPNISHDR